jgi:hypothetical protein
LHAQGTAFTYQGRLNVSGSPANGLYDFRFRLASDPLANNYVGSPYLTNGIGVTNGLFITTMDFGNVFNGSNYWLEVDVRANGGGSYTMLNPLQALNPVPTAIYSESAGSVAGGLTIQQNTNGAPNVIGGASLNYIAPGVTGATIGGGGAVNFSGLAYSNSVTSYFGTIGGGAENLVTNVIATVSGGFENTAGGYAATVGGGSGNTASGQDSTVSGGGDNTASGVGAVIGGGDSNTANNNMATVSGGQQNTASGQFATVGGGVFNIAFGNSATVAGGLQNLADGDYSTVSGGNVNSAYNVYGTVGGGYFNEANSSYATVSGGGNNTASGQFATVSGGFTNIASGNYSAIIGGSQNSVSGSYSTALGGLNNLVSGSYSCAVGSNARATNNGAFVWGDPIGQLFSSTADNQFSVRATGGVRFVTGSSGGTPTAGVSLASGSGTWASLSDRNAKENFQSVDAQSVLQQVAALPLTSWNYKTQAKSIRHLGPMAQDFYAAFAVGEDDRHITEIDESGVALAAIQGLNEKLNQKLNEKDAEIQKLEKKLDELTTVVKQLAAQK